MTDKKKQMPPSVGGFHGRVFRGNTMEENDAVDDLMQEIFFNEMLRWFLADLGPKYVYEDFLLAYETKDEEAMEVARRIDEQIRTGKTPFASFQDFTRAMRRYGTDAERYYIEINGEICDLRDYVAEPSDRRSGWRSLTEEEKAELIKNEGEWL